MKNICHKIIINFLKPFSHSHREYIWTNEHLSIRIHRHIICLVAFVVCLSTFVRIYYNIHLYLIKNVKCSRLFPLVFPLLFPVPKTLQHFPASSPRPENVDFKGAILDCLNVFVVGCVLSSSHLHFSLCVCLCAA